MSSQDLDVCNLHRRLLDYNSVIGAGKIATSGTLSDAANPGLCIEGLGKVGLPLSERDAAAFSELCHDAAFVKGSETLVDTSVRKTK